jgi:beta-glucosidase
MGRVGILGGGATGSDEAEFDDPGRRAVARRVATEGTVLLVNDGLLPLDAARVGSVAVIGPNAAQLAMGGGSSEVTPYRRRRVDEALAERLPDASISSEVGCRISEGVPAIDLRLLNTETLRVDYFDNVAFEGAPVATEEAHTARVLWIGPPQPGLTVGACSARLSATFTPDVSGAWQLSLESAGRSVLRLDGAVVVDNTDPVRGSSFYGAGSEPVDVTVDLVVGHSYELTVDIWPRSSRSPIMGARIGASPPDTGDEFERAVAAAAEADVAVVVVGSNGQFESEGHDRPDLSPPGRQQELVEAVLEVNPRTVVVVNAGSPVEMPWATRAGAVLMTWYPGEEGADALADMLIGAAEPSGRLPVTFPASAEDGPAGLGVEGDRYPGIEGKVVYGEGVLVGYRFYETTRLAPLFPFGFGLSYGDFVLEDVAVVGDGGGEVTVEVTVVNNGTRHGTEVVQVYMRAPESLVRRPDRELVGFTKIVVDAGGRATVRVSLGANAFRYWDDVETHAWRSDPGRYELLVGTSSHEIWATTEVMWGGTPAS